MIGNQVVRDCLLKNRDVKIQGRAIMLKLVAYEIHVGPVFVAKHSAYGFLMSYSLEGPGDMFL